MSVLRLDYFVYRANITDIVLWESRVKGVLMPWSITLGRIAGTAVRLHVTFILFLAWIGVSAFYTQGRAVAFDTLAFVVLIFACVLAHEFGHIFMARVFGVRTPEVTLFPIGGVASLERIPEQPSQELLVAIAGPLVNLVIALVVLAVSDPISPDVVQHIDDAHISLALRVAAANLFIGLFNMIPAYPMDGGRVLHALLVMKYGPQRAMILAVRIGQGFAFLLGFLGLFGNPMLLFIAIFIYIAAAGEGRAHMAHDVMSGLRVSDVMETHYVTLCVTDRLAHAVGVLLATPQSDFPIIDPQGKAAGVLSRAAIIGAMSLDQPDLVMSDLVHAPAPTLRDLVAADHALDLMEHAHTAAVSVVDQDGYLLGIVTRESISDVMLVKTLRPDWPLNRGKRL
jgi:Zn-dependent protease/predicted transcriptional regulator